MADVMELSSENFESILDGNQILFVDFWANWCAPCRVFSKIFEKTAKVNTDIAFASVDVEQEVALSRDFSIQSVPHLLVFKEGIAIFSESGAMPESSLLELITQAKKADVSELKSQLLDSEE